MASVLSEKYVVSTRFPYGLREQPGDNKARVRELLSSKGVATVDTCV